MGGSASKSDSGSEAGYQDQVWGGQAPFLKNLYSQAGNLFGNTNQGMQGMIPGAEQGMQDVYNQMQPGWQDQMQGGAYKDMGLQNQLMSSLNQSMNNPSAMSEINAMVMGGEGNNYADAMQEKYRRNMQDSNANMLQNLDARAAASGMSGGSRHGVAQAQGLAQNAGNYQEQMADLGYESFDKDLNRKLEIAGLADQNTLARQEMMSGMIGQQQGAMQGGLNFGQGMQNANMGQFAPSMMPWDAMSQYANAIGRPTILGTGEESGSSSSKSAGFGK